MVRRLPAFSLAAGVLALSLAAAAPAAAQLATEPLADDQYHVVETGDGLLRIDRQTGDVSQCRTESVGWVCRLSPDDRLAYEAEIGRLDAENQRLRQELAALRDELASPGGRAGDVEIAARLGLPSEEEVDVVMDTAEEVMRRFFGMVHRLRDDLQDPHLPDGAQ